MTSAMTPSSSEVELGSPYCFDTVLPSPAPGCVSGRGSRFRRVRHRDKVTVWRYDRIILKDTHLAANVKIKHMTRANSASASLHSKGMCSSKHGTCEETGEDADGDEDDLDDAIAKLAECGDSESAGVIHGIRRILSGDDKQLSPDDYTSSGTMSPSTPQPPVWGDLSKSWEPWNPDWHGDHHCPSTSEPQNATANQKPEVSNAPVTLHINTTSTSNQSEPALLINTLSGKMSRRSEVFALAMQNRLRKDSSGSHADNQAKPSFNSYSTPLSPTLSNAMCSPPCTDPFSPMSSFNTYPFKPLPFVYNTDLPSTSMESPNHQQQHSCFDSMDGGFYAGPFQAMTPSPSHQHIYAWDTPTSSVSSAQQNTNMQSTCVSQSLPASPFPASASIDTLNASWNTTTSPSNIVTSNSMPYYDGNMMVSQDNRTPTSLVSMTTQCITPSISMGGLSSTLEGGTASMSRASLEPLLVDIKDIQSPPHAHPQRLGGVDIDQLSIEALDHLERFEKKLDTCILQSMETLKTQTMAFFIEELRELDGERSHLRHEISKTNMALSTVAQLLHAYAPAKADQISQINRVSGKSLSAVSSTTNGMPDQETETDNVDDLISWSTPADSHRNRCNTE